MADTTPVSPNFAKVGQESGEATRELLRLIWLMVNQLNEDVKKLQREQ